MGGSYQEDSYRQFQYEEDLRREAEEKAQEAERERIEAEEREIQEARNLLESHDINDVCNAVIKYPFLLKELKNQKPDICLVALKQNGHALQFVKEQTPDICLAAVKQNGHALQFVKEQTPDICLAAVKQNGHALQFVKEQTPDICLVAVKQNGHPLQFVKEQTPEICLAAVKQNGQALQFVKNKTLKICIIADPFFYLLKFISIIIVLFPLIVLSLFFVDKHTILPLKIFDKWGYFFFEPIIVIFGVESITFVILFIRWIILKIMNKKVNFGLFILTIVILIFSILCFTIR